MGLSGFSTALPASTVRVRLPPSGDAGHPPINALPLEAPADPPHVRSGAAAEPPHAPAAEGLVCSSTSPSDSGEITISPEKSRMRRLRTGLLRSADGIEKSLSGVRYRALMVTPTYAPGVDYEPKQISRALDALQRWATAEGHWMWAVWRLEYGALSGRLHYHVLVWLPEGAFMPSWDNAGWWPHGMTKTEKARNPIGYLSKYASKPAVWVGERRFNTKGARWWGGRIPLAVRLDVRFWCAPAWVRDKADALGGIFGCGVQRLQFGWWRIGAFEFRSPWEFLRLEPGGVVCAWRGWGPNDWE